jgi:hypothetical protein
VKYKGKAYKVKQSDLHREPLAKLKAWFWDYFGLGIELLLTLLYGQPLGDGNQGDQKRSKGFARIQKGSKGPVWSCMLANASIW